MRTLRIIGVLISAAWRTQIAYRTNFWVTGISKTLRIGLYFVVFESMLLTTDAIGGFSRELVIVHFLTNFWVFLVATTTFQRNLMFELSRHVRDGTFDLMLTKPFALLPHAALKQFDLYDGIVLVPVTGFLGWAVLATQPSLGAILGYGATVLMALVWLFGLSTLFSSFTFHSIESKGAGRFLHSLIRSAQFPVGAFGPVWSTIFLYVIPIGILSTVPTHVLAGSMDGFMLVYAILFTVVLFMVGVWRWHRSLRQYASASS